MKENDKNQIYFVDVRIAPDLMFFSVSITPNAKCSAGLKQWAWNTWEKPKVLLKWFIHDTKSLVIL